MARLEDIDKLQDICMSITSRLTRVETLVEALIKDVDDHLRRQDDKEQRIPIVLLGAISAGSGVMAILAQLWLAGRP